jgi:transposase-like protein
MKRRQFTDEFRRATVARIKAGEKPAAIATELSVNNSMIYKWMQRHGARAPVKPPRKANGHASHDALIYLRHAREAMTKHPDRALDDDVYLFTRLALRSLEIKP